MATKQCDEYSKTVLRNKGESHRFSGGAGGGGVGRFEEVKTLILHLCNEPQCPMQSLYQTVARYSHRF